MKEASYKIAFARRWARGRKRHEVKDMFTFDTLVDRSQTGAVKWERRTEAEKQAGIVAMSVADMEFPVAPCVREAASALQPAQSGGARVDARRTGTRA